MPTRLCTNSPKPIAQTLFLGASVSSYSTNAGWGSQPSQLTVNLIEDDYIPECGRTNGGLPESAPSYNQFVASSLDTSVNHYTYCTGIQCYIDKYSGKPASSTTPVENLGLPGKVYYVLDYTSGTLASKYWKKPDPGFFGEQTKISSSAPEIENTRTGGFKYDIIDCPVYFKMGKFTFGGFVQSWKRDISSGGRQYSVSINGPASILNSCYVIADKFAGSIFSKATGSTYYGSAKNYTGRDAYITYDHSNLNRGILPNVFNAYGFLEKFGINGFGGSKKNEQGVSINMLLKSLSVLTSLTSDSSNKLWSTEPVNEVPGTAFSPFGRIISKCMAIDQGDSIYVPVGTNFNSFGIIPPMVNVSGVGAPNAEGGPRCQFVLDINDLIYTDSTRSITRLPDDIRTTESVMTVMDLINLVADKTGQDIFIEMVPSRHSGNNVNIIKVKTSSRLKQPIPNIIENTIKNMECNSYPISSSSFGKEKNETPTRAMIIGGAQQRLYQVKSYRLAYSQSSFIYNAKTGQFINYRVYNAPVVSPTALNPWNISSQYGNGKVRPANFVTTRNKALSDSKLNNTKYVLYNAILNDEALAANIPNFNALDSTWNDTTETGSGLNVSMGNYATSTKIRNSITPTAANDRWIPLYMDTICPFFGFVNDETITISLKGADSNTDSRQIRPVWLDSWTGQINVVINVDELPTLNVKLTRAALGSSARTPGDMTAFEIPYSYIRPIPNNYYGTALATSILNKDGPITSNPATEYLYVTESEIRAALAGFDNFLVYCLAKTYKPDLIEMVRRAYFLQTRNLLTSRGKTLNHAIGIANKETDWYWKLIQGNVGGDDLYPMPLSPDKSDGSQYIQEKALQDLKILHKFVADLGKYYGKKYMVTAWNVQSCKDESLYHSAFQTTQGYGYIFQGAGKLTYNYTPTNEGAWEEYGNIIDDSIVVGSPEWYSITDEQGKIKPLLGYNNNYSFDHVRYAKCVTANSANLANSSHEWTKANANPYFSFNTWLTLQESKRTACADTYVFPSLDISSLGTTDYIVIDQKSRSGSGSLFSAPTFVYTALGISSVVSSYDAWGNVISSPQPGYATPEVLPKSKLYLPTEVEEDFIFLDPVNRQYAKILINSPGINLYLSSEDNAKDPNRTVIANVAAEDLMVYLRTSSSYDYNWIRFMLSYMVGMSPNNSILGGDILYGTLAASSNSTANNVELAPKAAHPFFAGIPIKSNTFAYGPWTNYPQIDATGAFPNGTGIIRSKTGSPPTCTNTGIIVGSVNALNALNNMITAIDISVDEEFVPWNYGGMYSLDFAVLNEINTKVNYQTVIETAQVDMPGTPLFNIGGLFVYENLNLDYQAITGIDISYKRFNYDQAPLVDLTYAGGSMVYNPNSPTTTNYVYKVIDLPQNPGLLEGPLITSIQTSIGEQGLNTTYTFRTYTRKIGLFNKEENDRIKKLYRNNLQKNKQIASIQNQIFAVKQQQSKFLTDARLDKAEFGTQDLGSKLYGWSPSLVLIGQARPFIEEPSRTPKYIEDFSLNSNPGVLNSRPTAATSWTVPSGLDPGNSYLDIAGYLSTTASSSNTFLKSTGRISSTVQLYERKEVNGQLDKDYGMQSAMSLDGLLSPVSFYPTFKNSTFSYSLHDTDKCPFCNGSKIRPTPVTTYLSNGTRSTITINTTCDKCTYLNKKLNATLNQENSDIPINLITLNPIVVPKGEFKNSNSQNYNGIHPDKLHDNLSNAGAYFGQIRYFNDRLRHCIEVVARGSVPQSKAGYGLETSRNINMASSNINSEKNNLDYYHEDVMLKHMKTQYGDANNITHETNQRFMSLRGPLVLHSWGYDAEGYPTPNAADEPFEFDLYSRPMRFKTSLIRDPNPKSYKNLTIGEQFSLGPSTFPIYAKTFNDEYLPVGIKPNTAVYPAKRENDMKTQGGFDPVLGFYGDIIGKTQKWTGSRYTDKVLTNDFYLNWAERPDLWKVGPIDLIWDEERRVWAGGGGSQELMPPYVVTNSNDISSLDEFLTKRKKNKAPYQNIYATLEEDLIKQADFDETYATRAFIDDIEYSKDPLLSGYRRLIYVKDKCGYSAPRGTKLLCRYNRISGFYEPISKPSIMAKGAITSSNRATIELHYVQGRRSSVVPTAVVEYVNPMNFRTTPTGLVGMFTFINGTWTLISINS